MDTFHPDVIVINREGSVNLARLFGFLAGIQEFNHLPILIVSADSNMIDVYEDRQMHQLHSRDFFDFMKGMDV
jgi:hypothetical protein